MSEKDPAAGDPKGPPQEDPRIEGEKHPIGRMLAYGTIASVIGVAVALYIDWFPVNAAGAAGQIDTIYDVLLVASVPIFVLVMTVVVYSVTRFAAKPGDMRDGPPIHGNTRLEVIWVTIPFLMVTALADLRMDRARRHRGQAAERDGGQGHRASSSPGPSSTPRRRCDSDALVLPEDQPVDFRINTNDVLHSFWVPQFRLKSDAVPGPDHPDPPDPRPGGPLPGGLRRALRDRPRGDAPERERGAARTVRRLDRAPKRAAQAGAAQ